MTRLLTITLAGALALLAAGCASNESPANPNAATTSNATNTASATTPPKSETATGNAATATRDDVPANVRAAFPDAQSITKQHKDLTDAQLASIEKKAGSKLADTDHHSYVAFATTGGARRQIGAATIVEANGKELVVIYESKNGSPFIREVRVEGVAAAFLDQFKGKGHDDKFEFGRNFKAQGADEATAREATAAIHRDVLAMQSLYGAAHSH